MNPQLQYLFLDAVSFHSHPANPDILNLLSRVENNKSATNPLRRVDGEIFESGKKKVRIQNHLDTSGRGLILPQAISINR